MPDEKKPLILIVDDDQAILVSLKLMLKRAGYQTVTAQTAEEAVNLVQREALDLVVQDMNLSMLTTGEEGLALLADIRRHRPQLPVILITAWGSIQLAVQGIRTGAADFITKPWSNERFLQSVKTTLGIAEVKRQDSNRKTPSRKELDRRYNFHGLIGEDPAFLRILDLIGKVSASDASILITGESGTGKELVAEILHRNSDRNNGPFVKVNLGGISANLFNSEMFGHVKGAFTDAKQNRTGRFELAENGTIFLDEIGDLEPAAQVKLLRVLQDQTYEVLGSSITRKTNVRVISATNQELEIKVEDGSFREDLYYRINLITIRLPALRKRPGDIPLLARYFLNRKAITYNRPELHLSPDCEIWLSEQPWPGNIRQLMQVIERTVLVNDADCLQPQDFMQALDHREVGKNMKQLPEVNTMTLDEIEKAMIVKSLKHYQGHITLAAQSLGLSRAALYRRMEKYGIQV